MEEKEAKKDPVFRSDDISKSKARTRNDYFVNIIKNPLVRWVLRNRQVKLKKVSEKKPAPEKLKEEAPAKHPPIQPRFASPRQSLPQNPTPAKETKPAKPAAPILKKEPQLRMSMRVGSPRYQNPSSGFSPRTFIALISVICVLSLSVVGLIIWLISALNSPTLASTTDSTVVSEEEVISLRKEMQTYFDERQFAYKYNDQDLDPVADLEDQIAVVPVSSTRQSLRVYELYLLMRYSFLSDFYQVYDEIMADESLLTPALLCEAYDYRKIMAERSGAWAEVDIFENLRLASCAMALSAEDEVPSETTEEVTEETGEEENS